MGWTRLLAVFVLVAACSPESQPATTPVLPSTTSRSTPTTTTTVATTTTLDRLSEIEAIYQDLEYRRLDALYRGDRDAFAAVHVDNGYLERSLEAFEDLRPEVQSEVDVVILRVIHDGPECIAVENLLFGPTSSEDNDAAIEVIETVDGIWLISFVGTGWTCDGPHPFDS